MGKCINFDEVKSNNEKKNDEAIQQESDFLKDIMQEVIAAAADQTARLDKEVSEALKHYNMQELQMDMVYNPLSEFVDNKGQMDMTLRPFQFVGQDENDFYTLYLTMLPADKEGEYMDRIVFFKNEGGDIALRTNKGTWESPKEIVELNNIIKKDDEESALLIALADLCNTFPILLDYDLATTVLNENKEIITLKKEVGECSDFVIAPPNSKNKKTGKELTKMPKEKAIDYFVNSYRVMLVAADEGRTGCYVYYDYDNKDYVVENQFDDREFPGNENLETWEVNQFLDRIIYRENDISVLSKNLIEYWDHYTNLPFTAVFPLSKDVYVTTHDPYDEDFVIIGKDEKDLNKKENKELDFLDDFFYTGDNEF